MGKKVVIPVRVPEDVAAMIDQVRGGQARSAWVLDSIYASLGPLPDTTGKTQPRDPDRCPHPRARVIKGFCYRCGKPAA